MAAKVFFLLALTAVVVFADKDCTCHSETNNNGLLILVNKLSPAHIDRKDKATSVLPGLVSPPLECNCLEKNTRSPVILPEAEQPFGKLESLQSEEQQHLRLKKSIHFKTVRCPQGHAWIGVMCVPEEYLD